MADLDEMSVAIGEIRAGMAHLGQWTKDHEDRDQERYDLLARQITEELAPVKKHAAETEAWKQRGIGAAAVVGGLASIAISLIGLFWSSLMSTMKGY
jgi:hypothetical protein